MTKFMTKRIFLFVAALFLLLPMGAVAAVPLASHVFVVVEENHSYSSVVGSSSMPYLNSLIRRYGLATQYYADTHPSIGNYFMMTTGRIITNNDSFSGTTSTDNIVRHFLTAGKTWKSYAEGLRWTGYTGGDYLAYVKHHNPFAYFTDVANSTNERQNLVPFSQFGSDLANGRLPRYSFIVPNVLNDGHSGSLSRADYWLKTHIAPLISSPTFQNNGLLIIVFDESYSSDTSHGGGHVAAVAIGPRVKAGYKYPYLAQHQNLLRLTMEALGVTSYPGAGATANDMVGLF